MPVSFFEKEATMPLNLSNGTLFMLIVFGAFIFFATQWGNSRGPGSVQKDILMFAALLVVGIILVMLWSGAHVGVTR